MTYIPSILESFLTIFAIMRITGMETTNPLTMVLFLGFIYIYYQLQQVIQLNKVGNIDHVQSFILSSLFTTFTLLVSYDQMTLHISSNLFCAGILILAALGLFIAYYHFLLWIFLKTYYLQLNDSLYPVVALPFITFFLCLLCWVPYLLFEFPGIMTPDSINQFSQAVGVWELSNHHSVIHTLLIMIFYKSGLTITGDPIISVAFYTVFQMIFMAFVAAYTVRTMQIVKLKTYICVITMLFYALLPYHGMYVVTMWKDILFAGCVTLFSATLVRLYFLDSREKMKISTLFSIILPYIISGFMICMLRSNGFIAFIPTIPFILFTLREQMKKVLPATCIILLLAIFIRFPCMYIYGIKQADFAESISIPAQQMARVVANGESLSEYETEHLNQFMDVSQISKVYDRHVSDPIKYLIRENGIENLEANKGEFFSLWFHMGLNHPRAYLDGFVDQTFGYWYPDAQSDIGWADGIYPNELGLSWQPIIKGQAIIKIREIIFKLHETIPLYGLLWSMGAAFWAILISMGICFIRQKQSHTVFLILPILLVLTLTIATPVATDFRYAYALIYGLPLFLLVPFI